MSDLCAYIIFSSTRINVHILFTCRITLAFFVLSWRIKSHFMCQLKCWLILFFIFKQNLKMLWRSTVLHFQVKLWSRKACSFSDFNFHLTFNLSLTKNNADSVLGKTSCQVPNQIVTMNGSLWYNQYCRSNMICAIARDKFFRRGLPGGQEVDG